MSLFEAVGLRYCVGAEPEPREITFSLAAGEALRVAGRSGSGKTTLLRTLARLNPPAGGELALHGVSWRDIPARLWRTRILYVNQKPVLFPGTVESNLKRPFSLSVRKNQAPDMGLAEEYLRRLLLPRAVLRQDALTLSVGESGRVTLARSLLVDPCALLVDEPTAALDPTAAEALTGLLKEWLAGGERVLVAVGHRRDIRDLPLHKEIIP